MSLIDKASLIQIPSGYKSTKLYSIEPTNGDGDFTFARSSSATRVNSEGLIETASVLGTTEEVTNGDFATDTAWNKNANWSISGGVAIADGTSSNDLNQGTTNAVIGKKYFISFDVVSLSQGTFFAKIGGVGVVGNEVGSFSATVTATSTDRLRIIAQSNAIGTIDNVSVIQYIENDVPRLDYSGGASCASLLLEPQRTNLITYSESFDNAAWTKSGTTITANATTSPDGTTNADKIIASSGVSVKIAYQVISSTNSVAHNVSAFYKADEYSYAFLRVGGQTPSPYVIYNLLNQSVVSTANATSTKIEDYGSGWYRVSMTYTANSVTNAPNISFLPTSGYTLDSANQPSYNGDGSSGGYIYGAQLEVGSYPTSYIISNSNSQTTRSADVCNNAGTSATFNDSEGVLFFEGSALNDDGTNRFMSLSDGSNDNRIVFGYRSITNQLFVRLEANNTASVDLTHTLTDSTTNIKFAVLYDNSYNYKLYLNGSLVDSDTGTDAFVGLDTLDFTNPSATENFYGKTKQLMVFNEALSDEELSDLTGAVHKTFNSLATFYGYTIL